MSDNKIAYIEIDIGDKTKIIPIRSKELKDWIRFQAYHYEGLMVNSDHLNAVIDTIEAQARYRGKTTKSYMRIGEKKEKIYYDIGNFKYVEISEKGYNIVDETPISFLRNDMMLDQKLPKNDEKYDLWDLQEFINVKTKGEFILLMISIISYFIPNIPHHILIFIGNQGSSKSTVCRFIKKIIDPSTVDIYSFPNNKADLVLHLNNGYIIPYDNLNTIKREFNDVLCQVSTGGSFLKRTLYTDSELSSYSLQRGLILNGISIPTNQPDLLDRSIILNLKTISTKERKTEKVIFQEFEERIPYFLHHIFETIAKAKEIHKTLEIDNVPRMADAFLWSCAIAEAMEIGQEEYATLYKTNQRNINTEILADNVVAFTIMKFMRKKQGEWEGSVSELWKELGEIVEKHGMSKSDSSWAKTPSYLSRYLNQLKVNLEREGIKFVITNVGAHKKITLTSIKVKKRLEKKGKSQKSAGSAKSAKTKKKLS